MTLEFTPGKVAALLVPAWRGVANRRLSAGRGDVLRALLFATIGILFGLLVFAGFYRMLLYVGQFAEFTAPLTHRVLATVSTFVLTLLLASTIVTALATQYLSEDLSLLVSSPVPLPALYGARLALTLVQSSWMVVLFSVPIYAAFAAAAPSASRFLLAVGLAFPPLVLIATCGGSMVTMMLMAAFPARRVREILLLLSALFVVLLVFLIRVQQPERLLNPRSIYDVAEFFSTFSTPSSPILPSAWTTSVLVAARTGERLPLMPLALLWSTGAAFVVIGCWIARGLYGLGYSRAQESRPARLSSLPAVDRFLETLTRPFEPRFRSLLLKDLRTFLRDTTQWSQLLLLLALVVVYLYNFSVLPANFTFATFFLQNVFSFLNLGLAGFVLSAVAVRFVFTSVSAEGRAFWILRSSPLTIEKLLWSKFWTAIPPLLVLSQVLTIASNHFLGASSFMTVLSSLTILFVTFGIVGLGVGMGAAFPKFKFENVTQIAGSSGGLLYMIAATSFVAAVLFLEAIPVYLILNADFRGIPLSDRQIAFVTLSLAAVVVVNILAVALPMRWGRRRLEAFEI
ncbi:MAG: putative ABC transporter permease subunit [Vicinamibacteria bacterium]